MKKSRVEQAVTTKGRNSAIKTAMPIIMPSITDGLTSSFLKKAILLYGLVKNVTMLQDNALHRQNTKVDSVVQNTVRPGKGSTMK